MRANGWLFKVLPSTPVRSLPYPRIPKNNICAFAQVKLHMKVEYKRNTSTSFDFKNGFLIYHVEVRKVSANITSSFFPESSREFGECLKHPPS